MSPNTKRQEKAFHGSPPSFLKTSCSDRPSCSPPLCSGLPASLRAASTWASPCLLNTCDEFAICECVSARASEVFPSFPFQFSQLIINIMLEFYYEDHINYTQKRTTILARGLSSIRRPDNRHTTELLFP